MTIAISHVSREIFIQQGDLTFVGGTFFKHDTEIFRNTINDYMDNEEFIYLPDPMFRKSPTTVAGTTLVQSIEIINGFNITYDPSPGPYTVQLEGSNNNLWSVQDGVLNQNVVQVIPTNSAGLVISEVGSGVTAQDIIDISDQSSMKTWDALTANHTIIGSFGQKVLTAIKFLSLK